jgi:transcriptional regulator with XRE-family HTH domain
MDKKFKAELATAVMKKRLEEKVGLVAAAEQVGIAYETFKSIETQATKNPARQVIEKVCQWVGMEVPPKPEPKLKIKRRKYKRTGELSHNERIRVAQLIAAKRSKLNLKPAEAAEQIGITRTTLNGVERAVTSPSLPVLKKICGWLEIPMPGSENGPAVKKPRIDIRVKKASATRFSPDGTAFGLTTRLDRLEQAVLTVQEFLFGKG